jgi:hypothetical protein
MKALSCDRCKRYYTKGGFSVRDTDLILIPPWNIDERSKDLRAFDLCPDCEDKFKEAIIRFFQQR